MKSILGILRLLGNARYLPRKTQRDFIERHVLGKRFGIVADVGAGKAPYKKNIQCEKYIAIDKEDKGIGGIEIENIYEGIFLPDSTADLVICTEVLEHVPVPQFLVDEMYRILKPGGTILLTTPMVWPLHEVPYDFFRYTRFGIRHLLQSSGFVDITINASNGFWYTMLSLSLYYNKRWYFYPVNFLVNALGFIVRKFEHNDIFPLGQQVVAQKK